MSRFLFIKRFYVTALVVILFAGLFCGYIFTNIIDKNVLPNFFSHGRDGNPSAPNQFNSFIWLLWAFVSFALICIILSGTVWQASRRIYIQGREIAEAKQDWLDTFDSLNDIITIHDKDFNITRANRAAIEILKLPDLESGQKIKCFQHYHGKNIPPEDCPSCDCLKTGRPVTVEFHEPHLNKFIELRAIPRFDHLGNITGTIHIARDISDRKRTEEINELQMKRVNIIRSIETAINGSVDLRLTLNTLLDQVTAQLGIDAANFMLLNKHTLVLEHAVSTNFRTTALQYTKLKIGQGYAGRAALERRIVSIPDLREEVEGFKRSELFVSEGFVSYFAVPTIATGKVNGVLELFHRSHLNPSPDWLEFLEIIASQAAVAIENATLFDELQRSNIELSLAYESTIEGWSYAMDLRDKETEGHSQRVTEMTLCIAKELGIKDKELVHIKRGALLHDIGKIGIPDSILLKPDNLTEEERKIMQRHPEYAYDMLNRIDYLKPAIDIPYCHHEKWDGTGYPRGLKGEDIPIAARIFAVVDVWDALSSDRPYRSAWPRDKVIEYIRSRSGTHFDPKVVEVFLKSINSLTESIDARKYDSPLRT